MLSESLQLYKLIILYFLYRTKAEITNSVLSDFLLKNGYTNYLSIQETLHSLVEDGMIIPSQTYTKTYYSITDSGIETLEFFRSRLPKDTIRQINAYIQDKKMQIVLDMTLRTDYTKTNTGEYIARCKVFEQNELLLEIALNVPTEQMAETVCKRFRDNGEDVYSYLLQKLTVPI